MAKSNPATDLKIIIPSTAGEGRVWDIRIGHRSKAGHPTGFAWESLPEAESGPGFTSFDLFGCRKVNFEHTGAKVLNASAARKIMLTLLESLARQGFITEDHRSLASARLVLHNEYRVRINQKEVRAADLVPVANAIGEPERPRYGVDLVMHTDPGHGWLQVDVNELRDLRILNGISSCSYLSRDGRVAFLEEDGDLATYCRARGWTPDNHGLRDVLELHMDSDHWIRRLPPFHPRGCVFTTSAKVPA